MLVGCRDEREGCAEVDSRYANGCGMEWSFHAPCDQVVALFFDLNVEGRPDSSTSNDIAADPGAVGQSSYFERIVNDAVALADDHRVPSWEGKALRQRTEIRYVLQLAVGERCVQGKCPKRLTAAGRREMNDHSCHAVVALWIDEREPF